jgi:hypothetical protein
MKTCEVTITIVVTPQRVGLLDQMYRNAASLSPMLVSYTDLTLTFD